MDAGRRPARGVQAGARAAGYVEHRAVHGGVQAAESEARDPGGHPDEAAVGPRVDRGQRPGQRPQPPGVLVEVGVLAVGGVAAVSRDRGIERAWRHAQLRAELRRGLRGVLRLQPGGLRRGDRLEALTVDDDPPRRGLAQRGVAVQARVHVLVDEPLAERVDQDAVAGEGRRHRDRRLHHCHPPGGGAQRDRHQDAAAVVAAVAHLAVPQQDGGVVGEHVLVIDEAAGREDDAGPCPVPYRAAEPARDKARHAAGLVGDQRDGTGVEVSPNAGGVHRGS
ncbi:MAG: hypothetical protein JWM19_1360 [Actinomycetia bacterium]|nr:hypothetical protein [Actinomycetes bacterium]